MCENNFILILLDNLFYVANLGDSRAILSNKKGSEFIELT